MAIGCMEQTRKRRRTGCFHTLGFDWRQALATAFMPPEPRGFSAAACQRATRWQTVQPRARRRTLSKRRLQMLYVSRREFLWQLAAGAATLGFHSVKKPVAPAASNSAPPAPVNGRLAPLGAIFDTMIGSFLPPRPERLLSRRIRHKGARSVLLVGETHTDRQHHRVQLALLDSFVKHVRGQRNESIAGAPIAIGMEHFYRQHQVHLDRYIAGKIELRQLLAITRFELTFGYSAQLWQDILEYARENRIQVVGLNTPFELVQLVAHYGLDHLPERLYEVLPRDMDVHGNAAHRERFIQRMKALGVEAHGPIINDEAALQRMYESQVLWDEYMSESAALWLERNPRGHLCIFAGNGHVEGRVGIPDRLTRRSGRPTFTVVPYTVPFQSDGWPDIPHPGNRDVGDWLWYLPVGSGGAESDESDPKSQRQQRFGERFGYRIARSTESDMRLMGRGAARTVQRGTQTKSVDEPDWV